MKALCACAMLRTNAIQKALKRDYAETESNKFTFLTQAYDKNNTSAELASE